MSRLDSAFIQALAQAQRRHGVEQVTLQEEGAQLRLVVKGQGGGTVTAAQPSSAMPSHTAAATDAGLVRSQRLGVVRLHHPLHAPAEPLAGARYARGDAVIYLQLRELITAVEAPAAGTLRELLVQEGEKVDFGRPLFVFDLDEGRR